MTDNPCRHCTQRTPECHGTCEDYAVWKLIHDCNKEAYKKASSEFPWTPAFERGKRTSIKRGQRGYR